MRRKAAQTLLVGAIAGVTLGAVLFAAWISTTEDADAAPPPLRIAPQDWARFDPNQQERLSDRFISQQEYAGAFTDMVACLDAAGVLHSRPVYDTSAYIPKWRITIGPMSSFAGSETYDECDFKHLRGVEGQWLKQSEPTAGEMELRRTDVVECAQQFGLEVETFDDVRNATDSDREFLIKGVCMSYGLNGEDNRDWLERALEELPAE